MSVAGRLLFGALALGPLLGCAPERFTTRQESDPNGYRYETVVGDPTGLRLYRLDNGLSVYLARNLDEPRIRSMIAVKSGSSYDPPEATGLAHYLEHLLFNGTDRLGALDWERERPLLEEIERLYERRRQADDPAEQQAIHSRIDALSLEASRLAVKGEYHKLASAIGGVAINGYTNYDLTGYWSLFAAPELERHLMLEAERFRRPALRGFQTELEIVYEEFNTHQDSPYRRKLRTLYELLFPAHPYGRAQIGTSEHLKNPSVAAIREFYDRHYVPGNMALILVGDLEFDRTLQLVERHFGAIPAKPVEAPILPQEPPLDGPVEAELFGPGEPSLAMGFRFGGVNSADHPYVVLTDMMLSNGFAGLFDVELNAKQQVKSATSTVFDHRDHSVHFFEGTPRQDQTLEQVRDAMLGQLDRIARGDFDEWLMRGAVNDLRKHLADNLSTSVNLSAACMHAFALERSWSDKLAFNDRLAAISKQQLADFVRRRYTTNQAVVYLRTGEPRDVVRVEKPEITPIELNETARSEFAERFEAIPASRGAPQFVDYEEAIATARTRHGVEVAFVENRKNDLFQLDLIFDFGALHDRELELAVEYARRLGTGRLSADELKRRYYELGLEASAYATRDQTVFHLAGLESELEHGIRLLDDFMSNVAADAAAYAAHVDELLQDRRAARTDPWRIMADGLVSYALYGTDSHLRSAFPESELRGLDPAVLAERVRTLREYRHRVFYYGSDLDRVVRLLDEHYAADPQRAPPPANIYTMQPTQAKVYFVDFDNVRADVIVIARGLPQDPGRTALSNFFSPYISHIVHREIRESRSLAYSAWGAHLLASRRPGQDFTYLQARTQADKLIETLHLMLGYMKELPGTEEDVQFVREDQLKRFEGERVLGTDLFWSHERWKRMGIRHDPRREMYATVQGVTREQLEAFFDENIAAEPAAILIVGDRDAIDMDALSRIAPVEELDPAFLLGA